MATKPFNVLRVNSVEEQARYRSDISRVLTNIQHEYGLTLHEIAEAIDVSVGTISNAANKKADLSSIYRDRLAQVFGGHVLNPIAARFGSQIVPLHGKGGDILPLVAKVNLKIAEARCPTSPGGVVEIHSERLGYLPALRDLQRELASVIVEIEELAP